MHANSKVATADQHYQKKKKYWKLIKSKQIHLKQKLVFYQKKNFAHFTCAIQVKNSNVLTCNIFYCLIKYFLSNHIVTSNLSPKTGNNQSLKALSLDLNPMKCASI